MPIWSCCCTVMRALLDQTLNCKRRRTAAVPSGIPGSATSMYRYFCCCITMFAIYGTSISTEDCPRNYPAQVMAGCWVYSIYNIMQDIYLRVSVMMAWLMEHHQPSICAVLLLSPDVIPM